MTNPNLKWLINTYDPKKEDWHMSVSTRPGQPQNEAIQQMLQWLSDKVIGAPKATSRYTVEDLQDMEYVGVYELKEEVRDDTDRSM